MVEVGNQPFLDIILDYMASFGLRRFILGTGYKADVIEDYYRRNKRPGFDILFSHEKTPLDTGGAVKNAKELIKSKLFFVLNGDSFCRFNPIDFLNFHKKNKAILSILLKEVSSGKEYGEVQLDNDWRIKSFNEKCSRAKKCLVNSGVYIFNKQVFDIMPKKSRFSLEHEFFPSAISKKMYGYPKADFFIDIGTPQRYRKAEKYFIKDS